MTPRHLLEPGRLAGAALLRAQSDERLVDLTRAGNDRAFEAIVDRYNGPLQRYCSKILPDGRSEDAVQQAFLNAYNAIHRDTTPLSLKSWLFGIAHNVSLNILRQRGSSHEELEAHQATDESAAQTVERNERFREVLTAVAALPPGQRDALVLRELEGRGHEEIARELGVTGGAARQLISRARSGIRAAAASFLPFPLVMRLTDGTGSPPTAARLAELTAAGGGLTIGKVVAAAAVSGTLIGGAVKAPDIVHPERGGGGGGAVAQAADTGEESDGNPQDANVAAAAGATGKRGQTRANARRGNRQEDARRNRGDGRNGEAGDEGNRDDDHSGPGHGEDDGNGGDDGESDDHSGPGRGGGDAPDDGGEADDNGGNGGSGGDRGSEPVDETEDVEPETPAVPEVPEPDDVPEPDEPPELEDG